MDLGFAHDGLTAMDVNGVWAGGLQCEVSVQNSLHSLLDSLLWADYCPKLELLLL